MRVSVCEAAMSCFSEECSPEDLREVREACVITCQETDPSLVCEFGTCLDLGYLFSDIAGFELSCIKL